MTYKIKSLEKLKIEVKKLKNKKKKIVLCHGVFDLLHIGHIKHFEQAKKQGEILVVSITPDKYVNKGPQRPAFSERQRLDALAALQIIDYVCLNTTQTATNVIYKIKPNIYCKGPDYKKFRNDLSGEIKNELKAIKKVNGKIFFTKDETYSSGKLINKYSNIFTQKQKNFLNKIKRKYSFNKIKILIDKLKTLKVLVIGETIIDQYVFCDALGKSGKEPILVLREMESEEYLGGAAAICRHLSSFCKNVTLLSMIGEKKEYLKKIKTNLPKNIFFEYINKKNSPTIVKKRYLDHVGNNKVIGVYKINDENLADKDENNFHQKLKYLLPKHDLVIVSDYGHGLISKASAKIIKNKSKYLALNAQINAANIGYHSMRKYFNTHCVIINEKEIRHEMRDKNSDIKKLMKSISNIQKIKNVIVTRGDNGSIIFDKSKNSFIECDAYAEKKVDKIGAGDTMLSLVALCLKSNFDKGLALLIGSLAAAQSVEGIGNKEAIKKIKILKTLENILK